MVVDEDELGTAWEIGVVNLGGVMASSTQRWGQHSGALIGLLTLGHVALHQALVPIAKVYYHKRLAHALTAFTKDTIDAHMAAGLLLVSNIFNFN